MYVIFDIGVQSKVFHLKNEIDGSTAESIFGVEDFRSLFVSFIFLDEAGKEVSSNEVIVFQAVPNMRFIMKCKPYTIQSWIYNARWNSEVLKLRSFSFTAGSWHLESANLLLDQLIDLSVRQGRLTEDFIFSFVYLINKASEKNLVALLEETILITASIWARVTSIGWLLFGAAYGYRFKDLKIPSDIESKKENRDLFWEYIRRDIGFRSFDNEEWLPTLKNLYVAIENRQDIHFISFTNFASHFLSFNDWTFENMNKMIGLLQDKSINPENFPGLFQGQAGLRYYGCFISYSTEDKPFADKLYHDLVKNGVKCWYAPKNILPGKKIHEQLNEAIDKHEKIIIILSRSSMKSEWVKTEIANARKREVSEGKRLLIPLAIIPFEEVQEWHFFDADIGKDTAREIREYFIPNFSKWEEKDHYLEGFHKLLTALKKGE